MKRKMCAWNFLKRNFDIFTYKTPDGIQHEYTPDFKINGKYIEIKGYDCIGNVVDEVAETIRHFGKK